MTTTTQPETGIEFQTNQHDADIRAYVDDGEHAVTWTVTRHDDLLEVRTFYHEAGLEDEIGGADVFEDERTVSAYAREELLPNADSEFKAAKNQTDSQNAPDFEPTIRYEIEGREYFARAIDEDEGYVSRAVDGNGKKFEFSGWPRDATILATKNGEEPVIPDNVVN